MDTKKTYSEPTIMDLGDVTAVTLGTDDPGEDDPITMLRVAGDI